TVPEYSPVEPPVSSKPYPSQPVPADYKPLVPSKHKPTPPNVPRRPKVISIPKSESLGQILLTIPKQTVNDPSLVPLRDRLTHLQNLEWTDKMQAQMRAKPEPTDDENALRQSLAQWRKEYCDPTYQMLHKSFGALTDLHREITQLERVSNVHEQIS